MRFLIVLTGKEPLEFTVGEGQLIPGFENGVMGLNTGDKKTIEIRTRTGLWPSKRRFG